MPEKMKFLSSVIGEVLRELDEDGPFDFEDDISETFELPVRSSASQ
jgi:hypothetical protein